MRHHWIQRLPFRYFSSRCQALVAVFLCIICVRWQLAQEHSFTSFWQQILQGDHALLYLPASRADGKQDMVAIQQLNLAAPLLDLAGQFHHRFTVVSSPSPNDALSGVLLYVGVHTTGDLDSAMPGSFRGVAERFLLANAANAVTIIDRHSPNQVVSRHAALLTIINGTQRIIYINGTDDAAIRSLVNRLCDESTFPASLADSFQPGTMVQAVFPSGTYAKAIFDREPLAGFRAALERLP